MIAAQPILQIESMSKVAVIHADLIEKCKYNDHKAQMKLYDLYHRAVYGTLIRMVKNAMEAEDLMQETFLSAFSSIENFRSESGFGTWIKRIATNKALNHLRKSSIEITELEESKMDESMVQNGEDPTDRFSLEDITKAIYRLPDGYRVVITLYLLEGMDHDEIGEILGIKAATSRSQYLRAKKKLVELLNHTSS
jgi:RNA polymerase sigma factor (sigma-70 family)